MKSIRIQALLILCFSFALFMLPSNFVYAEDSANLNITLSYEKQAISGAEFSIYQVADLKEDRTGYTIKPPFKWDGNLLNIKTADEQIKLALHFEKQIRNTNAVARSNTSYDGLVHFSGLKYGMYLVVQTGATGNAKNYTNLKPYLVMVPQYEDGLWKTNVSTKPKPELIKTVIPKTTNPKPRPTPTRDEPQKTSQVRLPKTGYEKGLFLSTGILMVCGGILILFSKKKKI